MEFEVEFYKNGKGELPAREFLMSLNKKMRAKMADTIVLLQNNGYELREPYTKFLSDGIFELRAKVGSDISRILFFFYIDKHIILTNGFIKKTQKTPKAAVDLAKSYRMDYMERGKNEREI